MPRMRSEFTATTGARNRKRACAPDVFHLRGDRMETSPRLPSPADAVAIRDDKLGRIFRSSAAPASAAAAAAAAHAGLGSVGSVGTATGASPRPGSPVPNYSAHGLPSHTLSHARAARPQITAHSPAAESSAGSDPALPGPAETVSGPWDSMMPPAPRPGPEPPPSPACNQSLRPGPEPVARCQWYAIPVPVPSPGRDIMMTRMSEMKTPDCRV
jgi:hypothetical protein